MPLYHPGKEGATRAELRCPDPACNPYLCFAGMLQAGLEGIEKGYELPEPMEQNLYHLSPEDRHQRGIEQLPATLGEAIELAAESELVLRTLGEHTFRRFIEIKRQEWDDYRVQVTPFEIENFLPDSLSRCGRASTSCGSSSTTRASGATRSASFSTAPRCPRPSASGSPPSSASRRPSSSTTAARRDPHLHAGGSSCRSPATPAVGTAWLLRREGRPAELLRPPAGEVRVRADEALTFIAARPEWAPAMDYVQLGSASEVEGLEGPPGDATAAYLWAWTDEEAGTVRSRAFFDDFGIAEDEATGAAALVLCNRLGRPLTIRQGAGSLLHARPLSGGLVEVGGRVVLDEVRFYPV